MGLSFRQEQQSNAAREGHINRLFRYINVSDDTLDHAKAGRSSVSVTYTCKSIEQIAHVSTTMLALIAAVVCSHAW